jgi:hypothetical protein
MKEFKVPAGNRTHSGEVVRGKWFEVNDLRHSATDAPLVLELE